MEFRAVVSGPKCFQIEKPMILEIDNKGAKDLIDNLSVGGILRHIEVKQLFLRVLEVKTLIRSNPDHHRQTTSRHNHQHPE